MKKNPRRTSAQIAATKKLIAFNKRRRNPAKKKVSKKKGVRGRPRQTKSEKGRKSKNINYIERSSQGTRNRPGARLKSRRKANVVPGYYPNPSLYYIAEGETAKKYFTGGSFTRIKTNAAYFKIKNQAKKIAQALANQTGRSYRILK
ncbi:MAG: hypothetical protein V3U02_12590 [Calditrichia bacterium]